MCRSEIGEADVAERRPAAADEDRRAVEQQAVDQIGAEEGGGGRGAALDQDMVGGEGGDLSGGGDPDGIGRAGPVRRVRVGGQDDPDRAPRFQPGKAHVQLRRVDIPRPPPDEDRLVPAAFQMGMRARLGPGDPATGAVGERDATVERGRELQRHQRPPESRAGEEARHAPRRLGGPHVLRHRDAGVAQPRHPDAIGARIGVAERHHDPAHARRDQQVGAGRPARRQMRTRLQRRIDGRAARGLAGLGERHRLGMRAPAGLGPAAADHPAVADDHAADIGIGGGPPARPFAERDRGTHPAMVGAQSPHLLIASSTCLNWPRNFSSRAFCAAMRLSCSTLSISCCALICASVRSAR